MAQTIEIGQGKKLTTKVARLFPRQGEWTEDDYFSLPESNKIVELSEGRLIISPSPTDRHQEILLSLLILFANYVKSHRLGVVRCSPLDVRLYEGVVREPDIIFMANEHRDIEIQKKNFNHEFFISH
jgi:Uma2 family endonuclease